MRVDSCIIPNMAGDLYEKYARRKTVVGTFGFENKRFFPASLEVFRDLVRRLRLVEAELKRSHPECVTVALYGSHLKGYARPDSDVDVHLFLGPRPASLLLE